MPLSLCTKVMQRMWSKPVGETGSPPAPLQKGGAGPPLIKGGLGG